MALYRILLATVVALGLALAPVGAALAASQMSPKQAKTDCHGKAEQNGKIAKHCPCCDTKATCSVDTCGLKCFKLQATLATTPKELAFALLPGLRADPQKPPDWFSGPQLPPPRS